MAHRSDKPTTFTCASCGAELPSADTYHPYDACVRTEQLKAERDALRDRADDAESQITTLEWQLSEATKEVRRLRALLRDNNLCDVCGHRWPNHTNGGMCAGVDGGSECHCVMMYDPAW